MTFDITERDIATLITAVQQSDITRFHLVTPDCEIYISRADGEPSPASRSPSNGATPAPASAAAPAAAALAPPAAAGPDPAMTGEGPGAGNDTGLVAVTSPMIGIFYAAPGPGAEPFVSVGAAIDRGATVGLVEAMKLFTAVEARTAGTVHDILVADGEYVEFGQPLVRVRPAEQGG